MGASAVTVDDVRWLRQRWKGSLVVKGIQRAEECPLLVALGVEGIVVSNHGGRNQDCLLPTIEVLPEVVEAVGGASRCTSTAASSAVGTRSRRSRSAPEPC
jgi:L-lactate dehydrogenase (cytochrome)